MEKRDCWGCIPFTANGSYAEVATCNARVPCPAFGCANEQIHPGDEDRTADICIWFLVVSAITGVMQLIKFNAIFNAGENLTLRLRKQFYAKFLRNSAGWHDHYTTSDLTQCLSVDAAEARKMFADTWAGVLSAVTLVVSSVIIALFVCWRVALVVLSAVPLLGITGAMAFAAIVGDEEGGSAKVVKAATEEAAVVMENVRLITSMGRAKDYWQRYVDKLKPGDAVFRHQALKLGFAQGINMLVVFCTEALVFWWGAQTVSKEWCDFQQMLIALNSVMFAGFMIGNMLGTVPDGAAALAHVTHGHKIMQKLDEFQVAWRCWEAWVDVTRRICSHHGVLAVYILHVYALACACASQAHKHPDVFFVVVDRN